MADITQIPDDQLMQMLGSSPQSSTQASAPTAQPLAPQNLSSMSDADLMKNISSNSQNNLGPIYAGITAFNGSVLPAGQRIEAGIGAGLAKTFRPTDTAGLSLGDVYDQIRQTQQTSEQANPLAKNLGTGVGFVTSLPIAGQVLGPAGEWANANVLPEGGNLLSKGANAAARMGKSALVAAPVGAAYGAGSAPDGQEAQGAINGAMGGALVGGVVPFAGDLLGTANSALGKTIVPSAADLRIKGSSLYNEANAQSGILTPQFSNNLLDDFSKLQPQTSIGQAISGDSPFTQALNSLQVIRDKPITLQAAQEIDEHLGDLIDGQTELGRLNKQGVKISNLQTQFRNSIDNAQEGDIIGGKQGFEALSQARQYWAASRRMDDVERIVNRANGSQNPDTVLKNGFNALQNSSKISAYNPAERQAISDAATRGLLSETLKTGGSGLIRVAAPFMGGGLVGDAAIAGASLASKNASTKLAMIKADNVAKTIAQRVMPVQSYTATDLLGQRLKSMIQSGATKADVNAAMLAASRANANQGAQ